MRQCAWRCNTFNQSRWNIVVPVQTSNFFDKVNIIADIATSSWHLNFDQPLCGIPAFEM